MNAQCAPSRIVSCPDPSPKKHMRGGVKFIGQPPELDVSMPRSQTNLSGSENETKPKKFHSGTDRIKSAALRRTSVKAESSREHSEDAAGSWRIVAGASTVAVCRTR